MWSLPRKGESQGSKKVDFSRVPGQESNWEEPIILPACTRFRQKTCTELAARTRQERKPVKTNFKSQKENCQNSKGPYISPKSLCLAGLPCCRKNQEVFVPFALPRAQEGEPGKGRKLCCVPSSSAETLPRLHS